MGRCVFVCVCVCSNACTIITRGTTWRKARAPVVYVRVYTNRQTDTHSERERDREA